MESFICAPINPHLISQNLLIFDCGCNSGGIWCVNACFLITCQRRKSFKAFDFLQIPQHTFQTLFKFLIAAGIAKLLKHGITSNRLSFGAIVHKSCQRRRSGIHVNGAELFHHLSLCKLWHQSIRVLVCKVLAEIRKILVTTIDSGRDITRNS